MAQAAHKQLKKIDAKMKTRKALEEVQRQAAPKPVPVNPGVKKPARKAPAKVVDTRLDSSAPGFNRFCGKGKKNRLSKKKRSKQ
jgi:hypothetical protein